MIPAADATHHSSLLEGVLEHIFVGEVMRDLWQRGRRDIEVLRAVTDAAGYDVVIATRGVIRHIQLKASHLAARTARQNVNTALLTHPSGCVVWMRYDPGTLSLGPFLFYGDCPGRPLPGLGDRPARHTKADSTGRKATRPNIRMLAKGDFLQLDTITALTDALFFAEPPCHNSSP